MQPGAVAECRFDSVSEGVTKVEQGAATILGRLALVERHNFRFELARTFDRHHHRRGVARQQGIDIGFQPRKKWRVENESVLDDLRQPGTKLAIWQGLKAIGIGKHQLRLIKRADHVLAPRVIYRCFATHGRINLCKQRCRNLDERDATLICGGSEPGNIADYPAAERDQSGFAIAGMLQQGIEYLVKRVPVLVRLAIGQHDRQDAD